MYIIYVHFIIRLFLEKGCKKFEIYCIRGNSLYPYVPKVRISGHLDPLPSIAVFWLFAGRDSLKRISL